MIMTKRLKWILLVGLLSSLTPSPALAALKDIQTDKLPQDAAVLKAYNDVAALEEFVHLWSYDWRFDVPKSEVAARLQASLGIFQKALGSATDNQELLLLIGLAAHYAHNVDVEGAFDLAVTSLQRAHSLAPGDYRSEWFLGAHRCESGIVNQGMQELLSVEQTRRWQDLPSGFWDDYLHCSLFAGMPAHGLRAGGHAEKLQPSGSSDRQVFMDLARKRFKTSDPSATYGSGEVWSAKNHDSGIVFTNSMSGISFSAGIEWKVRLHDVKEGLAAALFQIGPYSGRGGSVIPNLLVLARPPKPRESLGDFAQSLFPGKTAKPGRVLACPVEECLSFEIVEPGGYKAEGDARYLVTVFKHDAPDFPGLLFERPSGPSAASDAEKTQFFRPVERLSRLDGTLYYFVALDTADSVAANALLDYTAFLKSIEVE